MLASGTRSDRAVLVTFDDGYADNLYNAKPLLERYDILATVFVTSGYIGATREFWYDDLERILLHTGPLPQTLGLKINKHSYEWDLHSTVDQSHEPAGNGHNWNVTRKDNPTVRHCLYRTLFERLQPLADSFA
jgi:peptidoglycan/xylan/chitin deacetylase (PgdA/CDA1 family)